MSTSKKAASAGPSMPPGIPTLEDLQAMMGQYKLPNVDFNALVEWQRKDAEALAKAQQRALEGWQASAQRRLELLQTILQQAPSPLNAAGTTRDATVMTAAAQRGLQQTLESLRELAEMDARTLSESWQVVQARVNENVANLQKLMTPKG